MDGTRNPINTKAGDQLEDIIGIVTWQFSFYRILPLTGVKIKVPVTPDAPPPTMLVSSGTCSGITFGDYNVENLSPTSSHLPTIASHIANYMRSPDILFVQEIQDNDGESNTDGEKMI